VVEKIAGNINRVVKLFRERNPSFRGTVSLAAHGMAGVAAMDILAHQGHSSAGQAASPGGPAGLDLAEMPSIDDSADEDEGEEGQTQSPEGLPDLAEFLADARE
jgi:hypothetical protein